MGFRENQSNKLTPIDRCMILDCEFGSVTRLKQLLQGLNGKADIGHIELAMGDQDIALLVRETAKLSADDVNQFRRIYVTERLATVSAACGQETLSRIDAPEASARLHYGLDDFDVKFGFNPLDFTQVNSDINPQMVRLACELLQLQQGERVLDLFCGLGNFSLPLARCVGASGQVIAVEGSEEMVRRGAENAKNNGIAQIAFYSQDLTKDFSHHTWANQGFDALLIDPPRAGAEEVMHYLPQFES